MEEKIERKIIINEGVTDKIDEMEKLVNEIALPMRQSAELVTNCLISPLSDETKERIVNEMYEYMKKRVE